MLDIYYSIFCLDTVFRHFNIVLVFGKLLQVYKICIVGTWNCNRIKIPKLPAWFWWFSMHFWQQNKSPCLLYGWSEYLHQITWIESWFMRFQLPVFHGPFILCFYNSYIDILIFLLQKWISTEIIVINQYKINIAKTTSEKAHARTMCLCSKECNSSPVKASQTFLHIKPKITSKLVINEL